MDNHNFFVEVHWPDSWRRVDTSEWARARGLEVYAVQFRRSSVMDLFWGQAVAWTLNGAARHTHCPYCRRVYNV